MANSVDDEWEEERQLIDIVKKKISIKRFKKETKETGTIDKNKFSIFGEVLADKKKNRTSAAEDEEDPEAALKRYLLLQKMKKSLKSKRVMSQESIDYATEDLAKVEEISVVPEIAEEEEEEEEAEKDAEEEAKEEAEEEAEEESFAMEEESNNDDQDDKNKYKNDRRTSLDISKKSLNLKRLLEQKKEKEKRPGRNPGSLDPNKIAKFGNYNVDVTRRSSIETESERNESALKQRIIPKIYNEQNKSSRNEYRTDSEVEEKEELNKEVLINEVENVPLEDAETDNDAVLLLEEQLNATRKTSSNKEYNILEDKLEKLKKKMKKDEANKKPRNKVGMLDLQKFSKFGDGNSERRRKEIGYNEGNENFRTINTKRGSFSQNDETENSLLSLNRRRRLKLETDVHEEIDWSNYEKTKSENDEKSQDIDMSTRDEGSESTGLNRRRQFKPEVDVPEDRDWNEKAKPRIDENQQDVDALQRMQDTDSSSRHRIRLKPETEVTEDIDWSIYKIKAESEKRKQDEDMIRQKKAPGLASRDRVRLFKHDTDVQENIDWSSYEGQKSEIDERQEDIDASQRVENLASSKRNQARLFKSERDVPEDIDWSTNDETTEFNAKGSIASHLKSNLYNSSGNHRRLQKQDSDNDLMDSRSFGKRKNNSSEKEQYEDVSQRELDSDSTSQNQIRMFKSKRYVGEDIDWNDHEKELEELDENKNADSTEREQDPNFISQNRIMRLRSESDVEDDIDWNRCENTKGDLDEIQDVDLSQSREEEPRYNRENQKRRLRSESDVEEDIDWSRYEKTKLNRTLQDIDAAQNQLYSDSTGPNRTRRLRFESDVEDDVDWSRYEITKEDFDETQKGDSSQWRVDEHNSISGKQTRRLRSESDVEDDIDWSKYERKIGKHDETQNKDSSLWKDEPDSTRGNQTKRLKSERDVEDDIDWSKYERTKGNLNETQNVDSSSREQDSDYVSRRRIRRLKSESDVEDDIDWNRYEKSTAKRDEKHQNIEKSTPQSEQDASININKFNKKMESKKLSRNESNKQNDGTDKLNTMSSGHVKHLNKPNELVNTYVHDASSDSPMNDRDSYSTKENIINIPLKEQDRKQKVTKTSTLSTSKRWTLLAAGEQINSIKKQENMKSTIFLVEIEEAELHNVQKVDQWVLIARGLETDKKDPGKWVSLAQGSNIMEQQDEYFEKYKKWSMDIIEENDLKIKQKNQDNFFNSNNRKTWDRKYLPIQKEDILQTVRHDFKKYDHVHMSFGAIKKRNYERQKENVNEYRHITYCFQNNFVDANDIIDDEFDQSLRMEQLLFNI